MAVKEPHNNRAEQWSSLQGSRALHVHPGCWDLNTWHGRTINGNSCSFQCCGVITGSERSRSSVTDMSTLSPFCLGSSKHEYENNYIAEFPNVFINNVCIQTNWESGNDCNCYFPACPFSFPGPSLLACVRIVWRLVISGGAGLFPRCHCNNVPKPLLPQAGAAWFNFTHWDD